MSVGDVVLAAHLLGVGVMLTCGLGLGLVLPAVVRATEESDKQLRLWGAAVTRTRGPALGSVAVVFITGYLNMNFMAARPGVLLLTKVLLALVVAGLVFAQVNGVGRRIEDALQQGGGADETMLAGVERSMFRLAWPQIGLVAVIVILSRHL